MKQCSACGTQVPDEAKFCSNCGASAFGPVVQNPAPAAPTVVGKKSNTKWIILAVAAAVAGLTAGILVLVTLINLLNPVNRVMKQIEKKEYQKAAEIYRSDIANDPEKNWEAQEEAAAYLSELLQGYRDEKLTYEQISQELYGLETVGILYNEIYSAYSEVEELRYARETYAQAEDAMAMENYTEAMNLYANVMYLNFEKAEDAAAKYESAVASYRTRVETDTQAMLDKGDYVGALQVVASGLANLPNDQALLELQAKCQQAEYDAAIQNALDETDLYTKQNDYAGALTHLEGQMEIYPEEARLISKRTECLTAFEAYVTGESLRLAKAGEFAHALSLAESGLGYFESSRVTELAMIYKSYLPVLLGEMEIFTNQTDGGSWASKTNFTDDYLEDSYGNTYAHSMGAGCGSLTYLVNFKYQTLAGVVAFPKGLETDGARSSATLKIYGDGKEIATFAEVTENTKPQAFTLDIASYEKVTLEWSCEGYNIWRDWGDFATIFDGEIIPIPIPLPEA